MKLLRARILAELAEGETITVSELALRVNATLVEVIQEIQGLCMDGTVSVAQEATVRKGSS